MSIYDFEALSIDGASVPLSRYRGQVMLIVNTASACGFTPQFNGLEKLHQQYGSQGLAVIGFPCNQFASQDPGDNTQIADFCQRNFQPGQHSAFAMNVAGNAFVTHALGFGIGGGYQPGMQGFARIIPFQHPQGERAQRARAYPDIATLVLGQGSQFAFRAGWAGSGQRASCRTAARRTKGAHRRPGRPPTPSHRQSGFSCLRW